MVNGQTKAACSGVTTAVGELDGKDEGSLGAGRASDDRGMVSVPVERGHRHARREAPGDEIEVPQRDAAAATGRRDEQFRALVDAEGKEDAHAMYFAAAAP
jgi:hypothetical protein